MNSERHFVKFGGSLLQITATSAIDSQLKEKLRFSKYLIQGGPIKTVHKYTCFEEYFNKLDNFYRKT